MTYYIYILTNKCRGVLYIGVTSNLTRRMDEHKSKLISGFSRKYKTSQLVYFESFGSPEEAIGREKALKKWYRKWKIELIEKSNPNWIDFSSDISIN